MKYIKNLVFGCSGTIGIEISKRLNKNNTLRRLWKKNKKINVFKWKNIACNTNSIVQISKENKNNELLIIVEERKKRSRRRKRKKKGKQSRKKKHKRKKN